ncbi:hypothetical protein COCVIDRAFT_83115 [Bipolaris victoriae FI3]|uniref:Uncharacterized protein n=1 Tax=Bipolaris victoriae (strain FI3) TaxID=930091 RepID=W7EYI4_BIPV3|nr:hypothetical protein COCVIDRAFT_83115 [Bipolaris victoriae FI3]
MRKKQEYKLLAHSCTHTHIQPTPPSRSAVKPRKPKKKPKPLPESNPHFHPFYLSHTHAPPKTNK